MKAIILAFILVGCGTIKVPSTNVVTDTGTSTATATDTSAATSPTQPQQPQQSAAVTESCTASASASVTVNGVTIPSANVPELAYGGEDQNWIDAMSKVPQGYHIPARGELVTLADSGVFDATTGAWWTATEAGHEQAWLYSPDSGFLGKNDKLLTAKVVYVKNTGGDQ